MTPEEIEAVARSDEYADKDRVYCAVALLSLGDKHTPIRREEISLLLRWPEERTQTAMVAAYDARLLGDAQSRAEGRAELQGYTVHRA